MKLATPEAFARDPALVHEFYNARRCNLLEAEPNAAHFAPAKLESGLAERRGKLFLCTQNIDDLHGFCCKFSFFERVGIRKPSESLYPILDSTSKNQTLQQNLKCLRRVRGDLPAQGSDFEAHAILSPYNHNS